MRIEPSIRPIKMLVCCLGATALGCQSASTTVHEVQEIDVPASHGSWLADQDVTLTGTGPGDLGTISLAHGVGSVNFQGMDAPAFFFVAPPTPLGDAGAEAGLIAVSLDDAGPDGGLVTNPVGDSGTGGGLGKERTLEIVAASPGRILLAWITCFGADLAYVYYETTDGLASTTWMPASGTCDVMDAPFRESVSLPALAMPPPQVVGGFAITGAQLSYDGTGPGTAVFAGATWAAYPFHMIDCTGCATQGWYELHTLFWDVSKSRACPGILYLFPTSWPTQAGVELAYTTCLPAVTNPIASPVYFDSSWQMQ